MKNSSRGSPIRSTSSLVTSTPLKGMTMSASTPSRAFARTWATVRSAVALPGGRTGKTRLSGSSSSTTIGPQKS